jgi:hypothetical protein
MSRRRAAAGPGGARVLLPPRGSVGHGTSSPCQHEQGHTVAAGGRCPGVSSPPVSVLLPRSCSRRACLSLLLSLLLSLPAAASSCRAGSCSCYGVGASCRCWADVSLRFLADSSLLTARQLNKVPSLRSPGWWWWSGGGEGGGTLVTRRAPRRGHAEQALPMAGDEESSAACCSWRRPPAPATPAGPAAATLAPSARALHAAVTPPPASRRSAAS